jgi:uncharacterized protein (DUF2147 family)
MIKCAFFTLLSCFLFASESIEGFWKTIDENTGSAQCIIAVYESGGFCYGRIIGTYDEDGKMTDSIYHPIKKAPGLVGNPFYSGLDIIWYLADNGYRFKGKILDPEHGKVYNSELWIEHGNLIVRGKLFIFGRSQTWLPATKKDFPKDFKMPDLKNITPSIPNIN